MKFEKILCSGIVKQISEKNIIVHVSSEIHSGDIPVSISPKIKKKFANEIENFYVVGKQVDLYIWKKSSKVILGSFVDRQFLKSLKAECSKEKRRKKIQERQQYKESLQPGVMVKGIVKQIYDYSAIIEIVNNNNYKGVYGRILKKNISWDYFSLSIESFFKVGSEISALVLDNSPSKKFLNLGLKQLTKDPWESIEQTLKVGEIVKGQVVKLLNYGVCVKIRPGIAGILHISQMSLSRYRQSFKPSEFYMVGDIVEAVIISIDSINHKLSLGTKQIIPDSWTEIVTKYSVGSIHTATVRNITKYGIFVKLEDWIDGLIHQSYLFRKNKIKRPIDAGLNQGDLIEVVILELKEEKHQIEVGLKEFEKNLTI